MGPLARIRLIEIAGIGPGPMAAMMLGDLGADVIRVDRVRPSGPERFSDPALRDRRHTRWHAHTISPATCQGRAIS